MIRAYFAHCMADYGTKEAQRIVGQIARTFDAKVVDPSSAFYSDQYKEWMLKPGNSTDPMRYWRGIVRTCDLLVFMPMHDHDKWVTAGVATEVLEALVHDITVYRGHRKDGKITMHFRAFGVPPVHTIQETRELVRMAKQKKGEQL